MGRLTQMEVVVLSVAERNQEANDVNERCRGQWCLWTAAWAYSRRPEGFLPMYFFW